MRPVNLIPPEQRRGERAPLRTGFASYAVVGGLVVGLALVTLLVLTGNDIASLESEKAELEAREASLAEEAAELAPYAEFATVQANRRLTVEALAESRFDWERVLRELAIVLPEDVWLVKMAGTVSPEVQLENSPAVGLRGSVPGPALELLGCGADHDAVARFVTALEDIDGVTRVGVDESKRPDLAASPTEASGESQDDCRTRDEIPRFLIVVAFDAAVAPATEATPPSDAAASPAEGEDSTESDGATEAPSEESSETAGTAPVVGAVR
jgi:Tfp pilus assembly protein PilN